MNKLKKKAFSLLILVFAGIVVFLPSQSTFGLSNTLKEKFSNYQIYFYNPEQSLKKRTKKDCQTGVSSDNQNYAGDTVWSDAELATIEENKAVYEEAASEYGFPWQVMATLHSMETGLRRYNPENGQGIYQLYSYTGGGTNSNAFSPAGPVSESEFLRQSKIAAQVITNMVGDLNNSDNVKRLFFKYNGTSQKYIDKALAMGFSEEEARNGEGSVYVMNRYDSQRDPTSAEMSPHWPGRYVSDGKYDPNSTSNVFGAFVKFEALGGAEYCDSSNSIVETALLLSWEGARSHAKDDPKPEYIDAMKEIGTYKSYCNGSDCAPPGASCDVFVSAVMRYSKADSNFPLTGPTNQKNYMDSHTELYNKVEATDISDLKAGDILVAVDNGRHIYLYLGEINGQKMQASASFNDRTGGHFSGVYLSDYGGTRHYSVYRMVDSDDE